MNEIHSIRTLNPDIPIRHRVPLPPGAQLHINLGHELKPQGLLATIEQPGIHRLIDVARALEVRPHRALAHLLAHPGASVDEGEPIAERKPFLRKPRQVLAPFTGTVVGIENGVVLFEGRPTNLEIQTPIPGRVSEIIPNQHVVVETRGARVSLAWARGNPTWGIIRLLGTENTLDADPESFNIDHRGVILIVPGAISEPLLKAAIESRLKALVAGSAPASLLPEIEATYFPVALVQGFGRSSISDQMFALFRQVNGQAGALDTGISQGWRIQPPEIIIPASADPSRERAVVAEIPSEFREGQRVRLLQAPYLGKVGSIRALPPQPVQFESGLRTWAARVELEDGTRLYVPLLNLEYLA